MRSRIFLHIPSYRDPELIPTIVDAIDSAKYPKRLVFGICRQFNPEDKFDNVDKFRKDKRFKIFDMDYKEAKGLPYARSIINEQLLEDEEYVLQLDSHHRFAKNWDETLITWHSGLEEKGYKPIITGYLPTYSPKNPEEHIKEPWLQSFAAFYPHGTIFIQPVGVFSPDWKTLKEPFPSRFISGHFAFARNEWAKQIKHDPDLYFSGEEIHLTVRSYTHGYDLFHPHRPIVWHSTMREERDGILLWDDQHKRGEDWWTQQSNGRAKIRQLLGVEDGGFDLAGYELGEEKTLRDYEKYAGVCFEDKSVSPYTLEYKFPPNPYIENDDAWKGSLLKSFYHNIHFDKTNFKLKDYDFWYVAIDDQRGEGIFNRYISEDTVKEWMDSKQDWIGYEFIENYREDPSRIPTKWVIWAHSKSQEWAERIEGEI